MPALQTVDQYRDHATCKSTTDTCTHASRATVWTIVVGPTLGLGATLAIANSVMEPSSIPVTTVVAFDGAEATAIRRLG